MGGQEEGKLGHRGAHNWGGGDAPGRGEDGSCNGSDLPQECGATGLQVPGGELWPCRLLRPVPLPTASHPHLSTRKAVPKKGLPTLQSTKGQEGREAQAAPNTGRLRDRFMSQQSFPLNK